MKAIAVKLSLAIALAVGAVVIPSSASAASLPDNCQNLRAYNWNNSICRSGSGTYRSEVKCLNVWGIYYSYGPWKRVGQGYSYADCGLGLLRSYGVAVSAY